MDNLALSANGLHQVAGFTNIQLEDSKTAAVSKVAISIPLKVAVVAFAAFETVIRTAILIAASPLYLIANNTYSNLVEQTKSAAHTILEGTKALTQFRAKQDVKKPSTYRDYLNWAIELGSKKVSTSLAAIQKHPKETAMAVTSAIAVIALYYSYPSSLSYFQNSAKTAVAAAQQPHSADALPEQCFANETVSSRIQDPQPSDNIFGQPFVSSPMALAQLSNRVATVDALPEQCFANATLPSMVQTSQPTAEILRQSTGSSLIKPSQQSALKNLFKNSSNYLVRSMFGRERV